MDNSPREAWHHSAPLGWTGGAVLNHRGNHAAHHHPLGDGGRTAGEPYVIQEDGGDGRGSGYDRITLERYGASESRAKVHQGGRTDGQTGHPDGPGRPGDV